MRRQQNFIKSRKTNIGKCQIYENSPTHIKERRHSFKPHTMRHKSAKAGILARTLTRRNKRKRRKAVNTRQEKPPTRGLTQLARNDISPFWSAWPPFSGMSQQVESQPVAIEIRIKYVGEEKCKFKIFKYHLCWNGVETSIQRSALKLQSGSQSPCADLHKCWCPSHHRPTGAESTKVLRLCPSNHRPTANIEVDDRYITHTCNGRELCYVF